MAVQQSLQHEGRQPVAPAPFRANPRAKGGPWRFVLLGAPGVGKGTQAELLGKRFGALPFSTGDVLRAAIGRPAAELSPAMRDAQALMRGGRLVPDETVIELVREQSDTLHGDAGFVLDGFPRTVAQAGALDVILAEEHVALDAVINYELPVADVVERISGRRICPNCKRSYHLLHRPPARDGICDVCGSALLQREDDKPEAVRVRLATYERQTAPVIGYYRSQNRLVSIPCGATPQETFARTLEALGVPESA